MARPKLFPRQIVCQVSDELAETINALASKRPDKSKSAATRTLIELGALLESHLSEPPHVQTDVHEVKALLDRADRVRLS